MYQTITLSPTVFNNLPHLSKRELYELFKRLHTEYLLCDRDRTMVMECMKALDQNRQIREVEAISKTFFPDLIEARRFRPISSVICVPRDKSEQNKLEVEFKLANSDDWKIIVAEVPSIEKYRSNSKDAPEVSTLSNYLLPATWSKIRTCETVELEKDKNFKLKEWLAKYIKDAKMLVFKDPYLGNSRNFQYLTYILTLLADKDIPIEIYTLSDQVRSNSQSEPHYKRRTDYKNEATLLKFKSSHTNLRLIPINDKDRLMERIIETDLFKILINHGLGNVDFDTGHVLKQAAMVVTEKLQE